MTYNGQNISLHSAGIARYITYQLWLKALNMYSNAIYKGIVNDTYCKSSNTLVGVNVLAKYVRLECYNIEVSITR